MQIFKVHVQITSISNPSMAARRPNGDLPMIAGFLDIRRRPAGPPAVTAGRPADRRRGIGRNFGHPQSESGGHRAVAWRWPADVCCLTFYDPVQGRKNPAVICRCLKTGIGGKSGITARF